MTPERRNAVVSTALVGTVVVVLGFGAGLGALFSGGSSTSAAASPTTPSSSPGDGTAPGGTAATTAPGTAATAAPVGMAGPVSSVPAQSYSGASGLSGPATVYSAPSAPPQASPQASPQPSPQPSGSGPSAPGPSSSGSSMGPMPSGSGSSCTNQVVANAMLDPFTNHMYRAHLERSPGQQANDLLNTNQYVLTHTVLLEDMVAPAIAAVQASLNGIVPFTNHMYRAHLERSPGQQVSDALNVNQYVTTHTVLVEDMTAPAVDSVEGSYGC